MNVDESTVQLTFHPNGPGHAGNEMHLVDRMNECVICGLSDGDGVGMCRHFVVPYCYRRHLPPVYKNHSCFDIVLLCGTCKLQANEKAEVLKNEISNEFHVPVDGVGGATVEQLKAYKGAKVLVTHGQKLPADRRLALEAPIRALLGTADNDELPWNEVQAFVKNFHQEKDFTCHGELVLSAVGDAWPAFVVRWRTHFVNTLKPRFLPEWWDANADWREVSEVDLEPSRKARYAQGLDVVAWMHRTQIVVSTETRRASTFPFSFLSLLSPLSSLL